LHQACATPTAWHGSLTAVLCGLRSMERDKIGSDLVPYSMTSVRNGGFYD